EAAMLPDWIDRIELRSHRLSPAEAEVGVHVVLRDAGCYEIKGRLMGPRCAYSSTVEVAYPFQPQPLQPDDWVTHRARAIIPQRCLWDPVSPFLYQGPLQLWSDGARRFETAISHGLRRFLLGRGGLLVNGRPCPIRAVERRQLSADDARRLRQAGYNTLLA